MFVLLIPIGSEMKFQKSSFSEHTEFYVCIFVNREKATGCRFRTNSITKYQIYKVIWYFMICNWVQITQIQKIRTNSIQKETKFEWIEIKSEIPIHHICRWQNTQTLQQSFSLGSYIKLRYNLKNLINFYYCTKKTTRYNVTKMQWLFLINVNIPVPILLLAFLCHNDYYIHPT